MLILTSMPKVDANRTYLKLLGAPRRKRYLEVGLQAQTTKACNTGLDVVCFKEQEGTIPQFSKHPRMKISDCCIEARPGRQPYYTILYYTILYYTILYYTILYYTILYYTILYYTILYYTILYYTILYYTILYYTILYYAIVYYSILQYTIVYYSILYYTILYYTIPYHTIQEHLKVLPLTSRDSQVKRCPSTPPCCRALATPGHPAGR